MIRFVADNPMVPRLIDDETGQDVTDVLGVEQIAVVARAMVPARATVDIALIGPSNVAIGAITYRLRNPITGMAQRVRRIEFMDESAVDFSGAGMPVWTPAPMSKFTGGEGR